MLEKISNALGRVPQGTIMDYGCGLGQLSSELSRSGCEVTSVETCPTMLSHFLERISDVTRITMFLVDSYDCRGIASSSQDGIVALRCLNSITSQKMLLRCLAEFDRVLRPGGWLFVQFKKGWITSKLLTDNLPTMFGTWERNGKQTSILFIKADQADAQNR